MHKNRKLKTTKEEEEEEFDLILPSMRAGMSKLDLVGSNVFTFLIVEDESCACGSSIQ